MVLTIFLVFLLFASLSTNSISMEVVPASRRGSKLTVMGTVYCDICSTNTFSKHSYVLPDVDVHMDCKFKVNTPTTSETISFSVNRTTDKDGVYKLEIPSVDGVKCAEGPAAALLCQTTAIRSSSSSCNVPGLAMVSGQRIVKSKHTNHCIYCMDSMSYRPFKRNVNLCG